MQRRFFILLLLLCGRVVAQEIPVLPMPAYVEQSKNETTFSVATNLVYSGVDTAAERRLNWHWKKISAAFPKGAVSGNGVKSIKVILLDKSRKVQLPGENIGIAWREKIGLEGYVLCLSKETQYIAAYTETGLFYALQTLKQLSHAPVRGNLKIADWPSFAHRAVYDDISRGPISTVAYVKQQIERLAELKINYLSFYIEHVVQPLSHPDFAPKDGKFTIAQVKELSAYAEQFHMQLIGSFQSFGHFEKILALPQYQSMGETANMISPLDPAAKQFLSDVIGELCDAFSAPYFNVNCDETFDLGKGKSKKYTDSVGVTKFYADHIKFLYDVVRSHNKQLMMWGDIALEHEEMLDILPKDIIYLTWEYGSQSSFDKWIGPFQKRGLMYIVCPGILNSYRMFPDMAMAGANIDGFLEEGYRKGAMGVLTTVWDDGGAFLFSGDWYGVYKAADKSWNVRSTEKKYFDRRFTQTAFGVSQPDYISALDSLMELRKITLTFNLNENVWRQKIVPAEGRKLIINNTDTDTVLRILRHAKTLLQSAKAKWNTTDLQTLAFAVDQYIIMMDTRLQMPAVAKLYEKALATPDNNEAAATLKKAVGLLNGLQQRYLQLARRFRKGWLRENQPYAIEVALQPFTERIHDLSQLETKIKAAAAGLSRKKPLPSPAAMQLAITESSFTYFQNWLFSGPYAIEGRNQSPAFLYGGDSPEEKMPKPGDLITYLGQPFRWSKYASPNGGIVEPGDFYPNKTSGVVYAFCTITTDKKIKIPAFADATDGLEVFCNGEKIFSTGKADQPAKKEEQMFLPLKAGLNLILLKMPSAKGNWPFSFRLAAGYTVTSQKHKYFLNTEKGNHEAE